MRYALMTITLMALWTTGCSQGEFAGDSQMAVNKVKKCDPKKDPLCGRPATSTDVPAEGDGLTSDDGDKIANCDKGTMIEDPNQTFSFAQKYEERDFLNTLNQYVKIPTQYLGRGSVHADQATADVVCKLKGFSRAISFKTSTWYSCRDNVNSTWNDGEKKFEIKNGCDTNANLGNTVCKGRLYDQCDKDKTWIFQKP